MWLNFNLYRSRKSGDGSRKPKLRYSDFPLLAELISYSVLSIITIAFIIVSAQGLNGQDIGYFKKVIDTLSSSTMDGRGYVNKGDKTASNFIESEFKNLSLNSFGATYLQDFAFTVNTFPGKMEVKLDHKQLIPGVDYIVSPGSIGLSGTYKLYRFSDLLKLKENKLQKFIEKTNDHRFIVIDEKVIDKGDDKKLFDALVKTWKAKGIVLMREKLTWGVSQENQGYLVVEIKKELITKTSKSIYVDAENVFIPKYNTQNVIGYMRGQVPDSFIVFSAHYDHLGRMGANTWFPGANDNASGVALMLDLAKFYKTNGDSSYYSMAFIAFAGEEAGLEGSNFYTENPLFPLSKIRFLINLDLMGNGSEGITVVNGTVFNESFNNLVEINTKNNYLPAVNKRGKAQNSDHYYFTEKEVPSFFIYTLGGIKAYHDVYDKPDALEYIKYENIFRLIVGFVKTFVTYSPHTEIEIK